MVENIKHTVTSAVSEWRGIDAAVKILSLSLNPNELF